jgi:hypothetical protein
MENITVFVLVDLFGASFSDADTLLLLHALSDPDFHTSQLFPCRGHAADIFSTMQSKFSRSRKSPEVANEQRFYRISGGGPDLFKSIRGRGGSRSSQMPQRLGIRNGASAILPV